MKEKNKNKIIYKNPFLNKKKHILKSLKFRKNKRNKESEFFIQIIIISLYQNIKKIIFIIFFSLCFIREQMID